MNTTNGMRKPPKFYAKIFGFCSTLPRSIQVPNSQQPKLRVVTWLTHSLSNTCHGTNPLLQTSSFLCCSCVLTLEGPGLASCRSLLTKRLLQQMFYACVPLFASCLEDLLMNYFAKVGYKSLKKNIDINYEMWIVSLPHRLQLACICSRRVIHSFRLETPKQFLREYSWQSSVVTFVIGLKWALKDSAHFWFPKKGELREPSDLEL